MSKAKELLIVVSGDRYLTQEHRMTDSYCAF